MGLGRPTAVVGFPSPSELILRWWILSSLTLFGFPLKKREDLCSLKIAGRLPCSSLTGFAAANRAMSPALQSPCNASCALAPLSLAELVWISVPRECQRSSVALHESARRLLSNS